jgi:DNA-binding MarR family transcriptional regulator
MASKPSRPRKARAVSAEREELLARLQQVGPRMGTDAVLLHQTVADRLGIHVTDLRCLQRLTETGPVTAGELVASTGLTTGAITRMLDRLERAGFVLREHDREDRRRVIVRPVPERLADIGPLYAGLAKAYAGLVAQYTDDQLALFLDLFERLHQMSVQVTAELRDQQGEPPWQPPPPTPQPAPQPQKPPRKRRS